MYISTIMCLCAMDNENSAIVCVCVCVCVVCVCAYASIRHLRSKLDRPYSAYNIA